MNPWITYPTQAKMYIYFGDKSTGSIYLGIDAYTRSVKITQSEGFEFVSITYNVDTLYEGGKSNIKESYTPDGYTKTISTTILYPSME